jgi:group I intron endonuclease
MNIYDTSKLSLSPKDKIGIYAIRGKYNNKHYVGQTSGYKGFRARWNSHINKLRKNKHDNKYLQNSFNKHSENDFEFIILEICDANDDLYAKEGVWINKLKSMVHQNGWNIEEIDTNGKRSARYYKRYVKEFEVISPTGEIIKCKNVTKFARENNLNEGNFKRLLNGKIMSCKGFISLHPKAQSKIKSKKVYKLIGPDQKEYIFSNMSEFCRKNNLNISMISCIIKYKKLQHRGWYVPDVYEKVKCPPSHPCFEHKLFNRITNTIHIFHSIPLFCKKYNLVSNYIYSLLRFHEKSCNNWINVTNETGLTIIESF